MEEFNIQDYVYEKEFICPVCKNTFKDCAVRKSKLKYVSSDIDLKPNYALIEPLFYDVLLCQQCGYATLNIFFGKVLPKAANNVLTKIKPNFKPRQYSKERTVDEAIERYKLALLSSVVKGAPDSEDGYICMKIAWLYRTANDSAHEQEYLEKAIQKFNLAFLNEDFPMCELDEETFSYMLAAFYRLAGKPNDALKWLSKVIISKATSSRLKDRALMLKNEIQAELSEP